MKKESTMLPQAKEQLKAGQHLTTRALKRTRKYVLISVDKTAI